MLNQVTLETAHDRIIERNAINHMVADIVPDGQAVALNQFSACDYIIADRTAARYAVEVKVRKDNYHWMKQQYPEGIFLRQKKIEDLLTIADLLRIEPIVLFAFENGEGDLRYYFPKRAASLRYHVPPPRRNGRNAPGDTAPVAYLNWSELSVGVPC